MREGARGRIARRVPGTVPRPREMGLCSNSRYQLGSLILSASLPGLGYYLLLWRRQAQRGWRLGQGLELRSNSRDSKPRCLLLELRFVPQLCAEHMAVSCWVRRAGPVQQPGRWPRIPGRSGLQVTPRSWLPARSRAFLSFWASVGTKTSKLAPCTWCRLCS